MPGFPKKLESVAPGFYCCGCQRYLPEARTELGKLANDGPPASMKATTIGLRDVQFSLDASLKILLRIAEKRAGVPREIFRPRKAKIVAKTKLRGLRPEATSLLPNDLYSHQVKGIQAGLRGENVVVATATASGKSLCYQALAAHLLAGSPNSTVLYLAPINALVMDQLDALERFFTGKQAEERKADELEAYLRSCSLGGSELPFARYDGAVPKDFRSDIRAKQPRLLLSNPEMLVRAILPRAHKEKGPEVKMLGTPDEWAYFFKGLRLVVIDELHAYRGVFGAHLANVLRRVRRMVHLCGGDPFKVQFFACSATIRDPQDTAQSVFGAPATVISESENGAPQHRRILLPVSSDGERLDAFATRLLAPLAFEGGARTIGFRDNIPALFYMQKVIRRKHGSKNVIVYCAAQPSDEKLPKLYEVRHGNVPLLLATSALELGIDVGELDAAVLLGYPGSIAKTWQMLGRAGRKSDGLLVYIAGANYLDQYWYEHIDELIGDRAEPEEIVVEPDNPYVVQEHVRGAALDHVLDETRDAPFFGPAFKQAFDLLGKEEEGVRFEEEVWILRAAGERRAREIPLRSLGQYKIPVYVGSTETEPLLEEQCDRAPKRLFRGAVFLWEEKYYQVMKLHISEAGDANTNKAYALVSRLEAPEYLTDGAAIEETEILTQKASATDFEEGAGWGDVQVRRRVDGYYKRKDIVEELEDRGKCGEKPQFVPLGKNAPPEYAYRTHGMWLAVPMDVAEVVPDNLRDVTLQTVAEALVRAAPLLRFVSPGDLTWSLKMPEDKGAEGAASHLQDKPLIHLSETVLGGAGLAGRLFERRRELLTAARKLLFDCPRCRPRRAKSNGCPRCVALLSGKQDRRAALLVLDAWLGTPPKKGLARKKEKPEVSTAHVLRKLGFTDVEFVDAGGMGQVWKGRKESEFVAIKLIRGGGTRTAGWQLDALVKEASLLQRLEHPNIVRLREVHPFAGGLAVELDWVDGGDLFDFVESVPTPKEKARVYRKIVQAVAYLHSQNVVHRDLKDTNVLFRGDEPIVTDFGIARKGGANTGQAGSDAWAAPEQLSDRGGKTSVTKTMDVWALGQLLGFLFTKSVEVLTKDQKDGFPDEIPAAWKLVLPRCLAANPKRRYADAGELLAALPDDRSKGVRRS
ncbi:MAG: DEAD/DEAH box helicase [Acidimicrobiia bacterium]|nr:DEAD/DEAH box helicase [Acidimicrobiia bacterium]